MGGAELAFFAMLHIVGGGKMGQALASGIVTSGAAGLSNGEITIVERSPQRAAELRAWVEEHGHRVFVTDSFDQPSDVIVAVKPKDVEMAVSDAASAGARRIVSVAAGVTLQRLHDWAGHGVVVIRAMPNLGALVGRGATAIAAPSAVNVSDLEWAETLLKTTGVVVRVQEDQMDAVTGLSGSGPAYLFMVTEAMIDAGVNAGLAFETARELTLATLLGSAHTLDENRERTAAELRSMVTTPAGTTAAGLRVLEQRAVRGAFIDAVEAAATRSSDLGSSTR